MSKYIKKYGLLLASLLIILGFGIFQANSAVRSVGSETGSATATETKSCWQQGYRMISCPDGNCQTCTDSSNGKNYFKKDTCNTTGYINSCPAGSGQIPDPLTKLSCNSEYSLTCVCDANVYKYGEGRAPCSENAGGGGSCTIGGKTFYKTCECPAKYSKTCEEGVELPVDASDSCDGKYQACKCITQVVAVGQTCTQKVVNGTTCYVDCKAENPPVNNKKYTLALETAKTSGTLTVYRVKALKDFGSVKKGDLGGWIEKEANLSQEGLSWVSEEARVLGDARVFEDAQVSGNAWVSGSSKVSKEAQVSEYAYIYGNAQVYGKAQISGWAEVFEDARVSGYAYISGYSNIYGNAIVYENAMVDHALDKIPTYMGTITDSALSYRMEQTHNFDMLSTNIYHNNRSVEFYGPSISGENVIVYGNAEISDLAQVYGNAEVFGDARISGKAEVYSAARVYDKAVIDGSARLNAGNVFGNAHVYGEAFISTNQPELSIYDDAQVYGKAKIKDYAQVYGNAQVYGEAAIQNDAQVYGNAKVYDKAYVYNTAQVLGFAEVFGSARVFSMEKPLSDQTVYEGAQVSGGKVYDRAQIYNGAHVSGGEVFNEAKVYGPGTSVEDYAKISEYADVSGAAQIKDSAQICGNAKVSYARIFGKAQIFGSAEVSDKAQVYGDAQVYGRANVSEEARLGGENSGIHVCGEAIISGATVEQGNKICRGNITSLTDLSDLYNSEYTADCYNIKYSGSPCSD